MKRERKGIRKAGAGEQAADFYDEWDMSSEFLDKRAAPVGTQGKEAGGSKPDNKNEKDRRAALQKGADSKNGAGNACQFDAELVEYFTEDRHNLSHEYKQDAEQHGKQDERIRQCITDAAGEAVLAAVVAAQAIHDILQRAGAIADLCHFYKIFRKDAAGAK